MIPIDALIEAKAAIRASEQAELRRDYDQANEHACIAISALRMWALECLRADVRKHREQGR